MEMIVPNYYHRFRCIAADCPDSCCKEWEVDVDPASAEVYRSLPGDLGDRLRAVLRDTEDGTVMTIENGRCPMWRQDGLCRIQAVLGHDALCKTCREFPRLRHDYGDFVELDLELSCPEAARLIFSCTPSVICTPQPGGEAPDYDRELMATLRHSRQEITDFLTATTLPFHEALAVMLLYAHAVQAEIGGAERAALDPEGCLADARRYAKPADMAGVFDFFASLEILTAQWKERLSCDPFNGPVSEALLPLALYGIRRYWLHAVSDFDLVCRVKFIITACILVNALGGDPVQTAQLFSKEIENDPDNLESLFDAAYTSTAFTDMNLLGLLLNPEKI